MSTLSDPPVPETEPASAKSGAGNLTKKAGLNAASYLLDFTARTLVMLLVTPILLGGLGKTLFGVWQILLKIITYLSATDGRPTQALKWVVVNEQTNEDHTEKQKAIGSAIGVSLLFMPVLAAVGGVLVYLSPGLAGAPELSGVVRLTTALLVLNFMLMVLVTLPEAVLEGMNLRYRRMVLRTGITIAGGVASGVVVKMGYGLPALATVTIVQSLTTAFLAWTVAKALLPWFKFVRPTWKGTRAFLGLSTGYLGSSVLTKLMNTSDVVVLGIVASAAAVTNYTISSYASTILIYTVPAILNSAVPGLGKLLAARDHDRIMELRSEMLAVGWLIMASLGSVILLWNRSFVEIWVGIDKYAGSWANLLIILLVAQLVFIQGDSAIVDSTLNVKTKVRLGFAATIVGIGLATLLIPRYGINGLCIGFIAGRSILSVGYPMVIRRNLGLTIGLDVASIVRPLVAMAVLYAGTAYLGRSVSITSLVPWMGAVVATTILIIPLAFFLGLPAKMRQKVASRFRRVLPKRFGSLH